MQVTPIQSKLCIRLDIIHLGIPQWDCILLFWIRMLYFYHIITKNVTTLDAWVKDHCTDLREIGFRTNIKKLKTKFLKSRVDSISHKWVQIWSMMLMCFMKIVTWEKMEKIDLSINSWVHYFHHIDRYFTKIGHERLFKKHATRKNLKLLIFL